MYGDESYTPYIEIYNLLKKLSEAGMIKIFFSWTHIIESLRYHDLTSEFWKIHCEVVDSITKGNCIIFPKKIEKTELDLCLADNFDIESRYSKSNYAFGRYKESFPSIKKQALSFDDDIENAVKKRILSLDISRKNRRLLLKKVMNEKYLKKFLIKMSDDDYRGIVKNGHNENPLISDLKEFLDRDKFIEFIVGSNSYKKEIFLSFIDHIFNFKTLVNMYSHIFPELMQMAQFPNKTYKKLSSLISDAQLFQNINSKPAIDPDQLKVDLVNNIVTSLRPSISAYAKKYQISEKAAERYLIESQLNSMPSLYSLVIFSVEYAKRHIGVTKRPRNSRESDVMDLHNLRNLPYVDLFVTDKFFADLVRKTARNEFGTRVFRNLFELKEFLEIQF